MHTSLIFLFFVLLISKSHQAGQWTPADLESSQITTSFSELQQNTITQLSALGIIPSDFTYKSSSNVYTQIVEGINWKFDLIYSNSNEERTISVIVWQRLPNQEEKFRISHVSVTSSNRNDGMNIMGGWNDCIDENFQDLKKILDFGLKTLKEKAKEIATLTFIKAEKVQSQVVNGKNYKFALQFEDENGKTLKYQMTIWVKDTQMSFSSFTSENKALNSVGVGGFLGGWTEIDPENLSSVDEMTLKFACNYVIERMVLADYYYLKLEKARSQVVMGVKYNYVIVFRNDASNQIRKFEVVVWKKLDGFNSENDSFEVSDLKEVN